MMHMAMGGEQSEIPMRRNRVFDSRSEQGHTAAGGDEPAAAELATGPELAT
jgi:hypothetical protein